ncbi:hypothetical protein QR680_013765 [Steinernema hermaphroditum]|uniref:SUN domain-containing protein n=1 Tax=Steinernema hermaphroditum TaxID=289476 RepID=A0AA39I8W3_9BILA|nr:hypothetical protein QR680_013765 [Steinernema hermaphroditum]
MNAVFFAILLLVLPLQVAAGCLNWPMCAFSYSQPDRTFKSYYDDGMTARISPPKARHILLPRAMAQGPSSRSGFVGLGHVSLVQKLTEALQKKTQEVQRLRAEIDSKQRLLAGVDDHISQLRRTASEKFVRMQNELKAVRIQLHHERNTRVAIQKRYAVDGQPSASSSRQSASPNGIIKNGTGHRRSEQELMNEQLKVVRASVDPVPEPRIIPVPKLNGVLHNGRRTSLPGPSANSTSGSMPPPSTVPRIQGAIVAKRSLANGLDDPAKRARQSNSPGPSSVTSRRSSTNGTPPAAQPSQPALVITLSDDDDDDVDVPVVKSCPNTSNDKKIMLKRPAMPKNQPSQPHYDFGNLPFTFADQVNGVESSDTSGLAGGSSESSCPPRVGVVEEPEEAQEESQDSFLGERAGIDSSTPLPMKDEPKDKISRKRSHTTLTRRAKQEKQQTTMVKKEPEGPKSKKIRAIFKTEDMDNLIPANKALCSSEETEEEDDTNETSRVKNQAIKIEEIDIKELKLCRREEALSTEQVMPHKSRVSVGESFRVNSNNSPVTELPSSSSSMPATSISSPESDEFFDAQETLSVSDSDSDDSIIIQSVKITLHPPPPTDRKLFLLPRTEPLKQWDGKGNPVDQMMELIPEDYEGDRDLIRYQLEQDKKARDGSSKEITKWEPREEVRKEIEALYEKFMNPKWPSDEEEVVPNQIQLDSTIRVASKYDPSLKYVNDAFDAVLPREYRAINDEYFIGGTLNRVIKMELLPKWSETENGLLRSCTVRVQCRASSEPDPNEFVHMFYTVHSDHSVKYGSPWEKADPVKITKEWIYFRFCLETENMEPSDYLCLAAATGVENISYNNGFSIPSDNLEIAIRD